MPDDIGLLAQLGIRVPAMFAGLAGGLVGAWADGKAGLLTWIIYCGAGGLTANWLAEPFAPIFTKILFFGLFDVKEGLAGFLVGGCALAIMRTIIGLARKWTPNGGQNP